MKLKDWDDEGEQEEKRKPKKGGGRKEHPDFEDLEPEASELEQGYGDFKGRGTSLSHGSGAGTGQGLRKKYAKPKEDMEPEAELAPLPVWAKALILLGLAVLAAIICAILWRFMHPDSTQENQSGSSQTAEASGEFANQSQPASDTKGEPGASSKPGNPKEQDQNQAVTNDTESGGATESGTASASKVPGGEQNPAGGQNFAGGQNPADGQNFAGGQSPADGQNSTGGQSAVGGQNPTGGQSPADGQNSSSGQSPAGNQNPGQSHPSGSQPSEGTASAAGSGAGAQERPSGNIGMTFTSVQESVTPKDAVNLRTAPNTADDTNIVIKIENGQALARTGINYDTGWSKIDYNGQTLYAVTQYLTTDLNYKTPVVPADPNRVTTAGGVVVIFENCDDWISPKEYVNLRTEPSTVQENATVSCQLNYGEKAHRTGYSEDFGWSRVEYNGQVLYVVTSFVYVVPADWTANGSN